MRPAPSQKPRRTARPAVRAAILLCLAPAFAAPLPADAQPASGGPAVATSIYTCRDASGRLLTSDRPIPECANRPMRELSTSGTLRREIEAPLTAEQQRERREARQRQALADEQRRLDAARDRALTGTYRSVDALEASRRRQLADLSRDIGIVEARIAATAKELENARTDVSKAAEESSPAARRRLQDVTRVMESDQKLLGKLRGDERRINDRFDEDGRRLRQLLGEPDAPALRQAAARSAGQP